MACNLHGEGETCHSFLLVWGSKLSGVLHKKNRNVVKLEKNLVMIAWMDEFQYGSTWFDLYLHGVPHPHFPSLAMAMDDGHTRTGFRHPYNSALI